MSSIPPCFCPDITSSTVPLMFQSGMDVVTSPMPVSGNPLGGAFSKSPLLTKPALETPEMEDDANLSFKDLDKIQYSYHNYKKSLVMK